MSLVINFERVNDRRATASLSTRLLPLVSHTLLVALLVNFAHAQAPSTDIDLDGISDLMLVSIQPNSSLRWSVHLSTDSQVSDLGTIGELGNHLIPGRWTQSSVTELGVVKTNESNKSVITWQIRDHTGSMRELEFGRRGDFAIGGADIDNNGLHDPIRARVSARSVSIQSMLNGFAGGEQRVARSIKGLSSARVFYASRDGQGDWIGVVGRDQRRQVKVYYLDLLSNRRAKSRRLPAALLGPRADPPVSVRGPDGRSIIMIPVNKGPKTRLNFLEFLGKKIFTQELSRSGDTVVGNFTAEAGEEVAVQNGNVFNIINPFSRTVTKRSVSDGIAVDQININKVTVTKNPQPQPTAVPDKPRAAPTALPPVLGQGCKSTKPFPGNDFIYKTIGSSHFTDIRRNTVGLIGKHSSQGPVASCIEVLDTKGNQVGKLGLYAQNEAQWRFRAYGGIGCASDAAFNGNTIGARARANTGSTSVLFNFGPVCYGPIDPTRCIGSSQC